MSICILKGKDTESIDSEDYPGIKACYENLVTALIDKGFPRESIRIYFDDENRQIHFDYHMDEIDALVMYAGFENKLQSSYTRYPFSEAWQGHRYEFWHYRSLEHYIADINGLCEKFAVLSERRVYPRSIWTFKDKDHAFLSGAERKGAIKNALQELRKQCPVRQGIFVNEIHHHQFPKKFLIENLDYFKQLGIQTLFFEFLLYDRHQSLLNAYFNSESDELPAELACYLHYKDVVSGCCFSGYTEIVKAAKKAGIRVVALDSYASLLSTESKIKRNYFDNEESVRLRSFNGLAAEIIEKEHDDKPYLVFLGLDHGYVNGHSRFRTTKSVAELLPHTCSVFFSDKLLSIEGSYSHYSPFFSDGKTPVVNYSRDKSAGVDIVESSWPSHVSCKL
ncbi:hypothetical protein [Legionella spiritensis]|uniref:hypothetical protein n=1 Tax=Legionella spiritensis TaxID=452 RepID=UPI000F70FA86|nr:hypothetical protein [Legionella spiritensis]VEG91622.1 Uncharacterised protein [Legionella spiritensis]